LDDEPVPKKDFVLGSLSTKQIQSLITNAVKAYLWEGVRKTNLYSKSYMKRIEVL